ncbi:MAG: ParB/RepB/Spo0J family partition protein [Thermoanaerobaculales bacterium]|nr:ParB/RepB/Spo0J family partition protein [Thermoanaerobaculales bacterium]
MRHDRHYVDELTQRMGEGIGRMVRITVITSNQDQPRSNLGDLSDLVNSIEVHGILEPLLVRKREGGQYELVSGERRFHAAMQAGLTEVPCIELEVSDEHALEIALIENLQREDLSAFEEAEGFQTLIGKYGYTHQQVAEAVGRSRVTITESLKILSIPPEIRSACRHADITAKGILLEIARVQDPKTMNELIRAIVEERLDRAALRELRKGDRSPGDEVEATPAIQENPSPKMRPFVWKYQPENKPFRVALSFATEKEPEPYEVIAALEELLAELRGNLSQS